MSSRRADWCCPEARRIGSRIACSSWSHGGVYVVGAYPGVTGENVADFLNLILSGVPDLKLNIEDIFGADDRVVVRFKFEGTHEGEIFGQPGSGKQLSVNAINIYRLEDGKVAETWQLQDAAGFLEQVKQS